MSNDWRTNYKWEQLLLELENDISGLTAMEEASETEVVYKTFKSEALKLRDITPTPKNTFERAEVISRQLSRLTFELEDVKEEVMRALGSRVQSPKSRQTAPSTPMSVPKLRDVVKKELGLAVRQHEADFQKVMQLYLEELRKAVRTNASLRGPPSATANRQIERQRRILKDAGGKDGSGPTRSSTDCDVQDVLRNISYHMSQRNRRPEPRMLSNKNPSNHPSYYESPRKSVYASSGNSAAPILRALEKSDSKTKPRKCWR
ncbi:hypothetical protein DFS34DRAFT_622092 [Phlyctochytrium arcticum]|nr:hypothetical protein DFS34DRAFT_622092 [Phlyctochytrium arcticum]